MPVSQAAIDRFLSWRPPEIRAVKERPIAELVDRIELLCRASFTPRTVPRVHQLEALVFALEQRRALLFMKPRLGKSATSIWYAEMLRKSGDFHKKGLVIVPVPVICDVWEYETTLHSGMTIATVTDQASLHRALSSPCDLIVLSWYTLQVLFCVKGKDKKTEKPKLIADKKQLQALATRFDLVIIDESHLAKNTTSLRFQMGEILTTNCPNVLGLSGTPHGRNPFDLWAQAFLVDRGRTLGFNYHFFRYAFGKPEENYFARGGAAIVYDSTKQHILEQRISALAISYGWEGYMDMPEIVSNVVKLKMTADQAKLYKDAIMDLVKSQGNRISIENIFVRLRQISSGYLPFRTEDGHESILRCSSAKMDWIQELIEQAPPEVKIIIFHDFIETGKLLTAHLTKCKIKHSWLYSGTKDKSAAVKDFQTGAVNVFVAHPASGGVGIDLSMADYLVFLESPVSPTIRQQAEARPLGDKRGGRCLMVDDIICSPVEQRILDCVKEGKDLLAEIIYHGADMRDFL
jgi:hypothetical protein